MTEADWEALAIYVNRLRHMLNLDFWAIEIERERPEVESAYAATHIQSQGNVAKLRICHDFRGFEPDLQRVVIIHELLHLYTDRLFSDMLDVIEDIGSSQTYQATRVVFRTQYERLTDALAYAIAPAHPLLEWPS